MLSKVAIVESDKSFREAMAALIEAMGHETQGFAELAECVAAWDSNDFACVVVNSKRDGNAELDLLLPTIQRNQANRVILLTDCSSTSTVVRAIRGGLSNLLEHPFHFSKLREAVAEAIEEHASLLQAEGKQIAPEISQLLTPQEEDIAKLMLEGAAIKEIAARLDVSIRTIHYRKNEIYRKINVDSRAEAINILKLNTSASRLSTVSSPSTIPASV